MFDGECIIDIVMLIEYNIVMLLFLVTDCIALFYSGETELEELSDEEEEEKDDTKILEEGKEEAVDEQSRKKVRLKGKKQGKVQVPLRNGDTYASMSAGKARSMPGTLRGRSGVLTKWNTHFKTNLTGTS